ncbi:MAG: hypothetical protein SPG10_09545, partial [Enterocloster clostridioformis]|nr:hypothetical protein [Enterocloster clostridioformis]
NHSGQTWLSRYDCPLSESPSKLLNRVVPNGTLRGVEGEVKISPIRLSQEITCMIQAIKNNKVGSDAHRPKKGPPAKHQPAEALLNVKDN